MGSKTITLKNADGTLYANKKVHVEQKEHEFLFGQGAFDFLRYVKCEENSKDQAFFKERIDRWLEVFNYATLPFYWGNFESKEGKPDTQDLKKAAKFLADKNITVKGHPLCWHTVCAPWLMNYDNETILQKQLARIEREVSDFKGLIDRWDVINEVCIMNEFNKYDNAVTRICNYKGKYELTSLVFDKAKKTNPQGIFLINDFNTTDAYAQLIEKLLNMGVPISVIGIQSHQHQGYWGLEKLNKVLERFEVFKLPIHFTENTILSGSLVPPEIEDLNDFQVKEWPSTPEGEKRQAEQVIEMYKTLFAHPLVQAVTGWDLCDGEWLGAPSGVLHKDNSPKEVFYALKNLIKKELHTSYDTVTDSNGNIILEGFKGKYEISYSDNLNLEVTL